MIPVFSQGSHVSHTTFLSRIRSVPAAVIIMLLIISSAALLFCTCRDGGRAKAGSSASRLIIEERHEKLAAYFASYRLKPVQIVENRDYTLSDIKLGNHKILWLDSVGENRIKIDDDLFALKGKSTLNLVNGKKDCPDFSNSWDLIKLYKFNDRELVGIRMQYYPCSGLACAVNYYLVYDLATKTQNYFGTFRTDDELELYDFNNDNKLDYVSKSFEGDAQGSTPMGFIYELYSMESSGQFYPFMKSDSTACSIKLTTFPGDPSKSEAFKQNWISDINIK
jgi:hypothetical protein